MRPGRRKKAGDKTEDGGGGDGGKRDRQTAAQRRARRRRPRATGLDWTGSGQLGNGGRAGTFQVRLWETRARARHGMGQGMARQGRTGQGMAGNRAGTGLWALGGGRLGTGNSKTVHRPHANQNRLDPPDGDGPRDQQGEPLLGVYQQLSRPERLKRGIWPMLALPVHYVLCAQGRTVKFGPASHSDDSRQGPTHSSRHQGRHGTPAGPGTLLPATPSLPLNPVPGFLSQSKTPIAHCKLGN